MFLDQPSELWWIEYSFRCVSGGGIEGFFGPIGLRVDVGDELYLNNGTYNNLRVTFGPTLRF